MLGIEYAGYASSFFSTPGLNITLRLIEADGVMTSVAGGIDTYRPQIAAGNITIDALEIEGFSD
jgi:hypothetical protein